jgi:hypothetical protein
MSDEVVTAFARDLAAEVDESVRSDEGSVYSEEEFTRIVLDKLGNEGTLENPILLWQEGAFGASKYKITGYSLPDEEDRLLLTTTVYTGEFPPRRLTLDEIVVAFRQALQFYESSCSGLHEKIDPAHTDAGDLARRIFELRGTIGVVRLVLVTDGLVAIAPLDMRRASDGTRVVVDMFGIEQLYRVLGRGLTHDDIVLDFLKETGQALPCLKASSEGSSYEAYLAAIPGSALESAYEKYGTRLLELNVRAFLGVRGRKSVNAGLRKTILEEPSNFLAFNNGIVAIADEIELSTNGAGTASIRSLRGLQIVNGGQTTASLHRAKKQDSANLDSIVVPAKIIKVQRENLDAMVAAVSRSANSQNTVQPADFSANDPFHVALERLANDTWIADGKSRWFYERARGSYDAASLKASFTNIQKTRFASETPKERRFSKTDMAKYLNAWDGFPYLVSYGNQKNFQYFMQRLKEEYPGGLQPDTDWYKAFVGKAILFRTVQAIVKARKFPAYQANIVAYTVAALAWKANGSFNFDLTWSTQTASPELRALIGNWATQIDHVLRLTAGKSMPSEWAKKQQCWDEIRDTKLQVPVPAPPEFVAVASSSTVIELESRSSSGDTASDVDREDLICNIRQMFRGAEVRSRDDVISELQTLAGGQRLDDQVREELDNGIRTAVRRGILENRGDGLSLFTRNIGDYERGVLKDQFVAAMQGHAWAERNDSIRRFSRWLGFRRTGPSIDDTARSVINGLIRDGKLESNGSQIRRRG